MEIVKSTNITLEEFQAHADLHCVPKTQHADVIGRYKNIYAWHLRFPRRYVNPIGYTYSPGQVRIELHEQQHICTRLAAELRQVRTAQHGRGDLKKADDMQRSSRKAEAEVGCPKEIAGSAQVPVQPPQVETSAQQSGNRQQARLAAERRATAEVQRGIGDMEHVRSMQASAASRKDIFGEAAASKLRENLKRKRALSGTPITTPSHAAQTQDSATPAAVLVPSVTPTTRNVVFADALVLTHHRRQILKDSHLLPHLIVARPMPVSRTLHRFLQHRFRYNVDIHSLEVGGDGDCLFHSVAAGLEHLLLESTAASRHVLRHVPLTVFSSGKLAVVQHLRNMCAEQIDKWSWEELLNYYVRASMDQELGEWRDLWNPTALLREYNLDILIGCDTVRAVSDNPNGDVGDIFIIIDKSDARVGGNTSQQLQTPIAQGRAFLMALRVELQNVFRTLGNTHWGDSTDARLLTDALDVGFFLFADQLQGNSTQCLVAFDLSRTDFPLFLALWWNNHTHFRSLEIETSSNTSFRSCWSRGQAPQILLDDYHSVNRANTR